MTTKSSAVEKKLGILILNLSEFRDLKLRPGQIASVAVEVEAMGLTCYEIVARWDENAFQLLGDAQRRFQADERRKSRRKSLWRFKALPSGHRADTSVQFWVRGGGIVQSAALALNRQH